MKLIELVRSTLNEIKESADITVSVLSFEPGSFDEERLAKYFFESTGIQIKSDLKGLLNFPGQTNVEWRGKGEGKLVPSGSFRIENIETSLLQQGNIVPINNEDIPAETLTLLKECHYFDTFPNFTWDIATLLYYDKKADSFKLFFLDKLELFPLELSPAEYIQMCMLTKGMYYWQYLFCDASAQKSVNVYKHPYIDQIIPFLRATFPEHDYSTLESKYKAWQNAIAK
jgi:hypothetical protein